MHKAKIVMLCRRGSASAMVYNALSEKFSVECAIIENAPDRKTFLKNRIKKLGLFKVAGQVMFSAFLVPLLRKEGRERKQEILSQYGASDDLKPLLNSDPVLVNSVNDKECIDALRRLNPDIVVVNGTRIISEEVLGCIDATFINMHAGITPKYRGCHGAYWALREGDRDNAGVTVHLVDKGIDTGGILCQSVVPLTDKDNFTTYPVLQTCVGIADEIRAINDIIDGKVEIKKNNLPSGLYSHPTFFGYIYHRLVHKVR